MHIAGPLGFSLLGYYDEFFPPFEKQHSGPCSLLPPKKPSSWCQEDLVCESDDLDKLPNPAKNTLAECESPSLD